MPKVPSYVKTFVVIFQIMDKTALNMIKNGIQLNQVILKWLKIKIFKGY
jgi:hypothetical protein